MSPNDKAKQTSIIDVIKDPLAGLKIYTAKEVLETQSRMTWLVPQLIQLESTVILVGPAKIGKTTFAMALANAISNGSTFLGVDCTKSTVLYVNLEGGFDSSKYKLELVKISQESDLYLVTQKPNNRLPYADNLRLIIQRTRAKVIILDSLMLWAGKIKVNDYDDVYYHIGQLSEIAKDLGVTVLFTHHSAKNGESSSDGCLGSTAWFGATDTKIQLIKRKSISYLKVDHRNAKSLDEVPVFINPESGEISLSKSQPSDNEDPLRAEILNFISLAPDSSSPYTVIKKEIKGNSGALSETLKDLCAEGLITRQVGKTQGNPIVFSLCPQVEATDSPVINQGTQNA